MKIFVKAKPNAKEERVEKIDPPSPKGFGRASDTHFIVSVKEPSVKGKANAAIVRALADYFKITYSRICLVSGFTCKEKLFEVK